MKILTIFIFCCCSIVNVFGQENKYAFLLQNRSFNSWSDFKELKSNTLAVKELLVEQGFLEKNITECKDLTTNGFRLEFQKFISKLPEGAICVVFLGSHGGITPDLNNDESSNGDIDRLDEYLVCTDTPSVINSTKKGSIDYHDFAIIDDEFGMYNDQILNKIKRNGHYLLLAEYCHSDGTERSGSSGNIYSQLQDGSRNIDINDYLTVSKQDKAHFVIFAATNNILPINLSPISPFVSALKNAFSSFKFSTPTYEELFKEFKPLIEKEFEKKEGKPTLKGLKNADIYTKVFNGNWKNILEIGFSHIVRFGKPVERSKGNSEISNFEFKVNIEKAYTFQKGMYLDIYKNKLFLTEGIINEVDSNSINISFFSKFSPDEKVDYIITESQRQKKAFLDFRNLKNKTQLDKTMSLLSIYDLNVDVFINAYHVINSEPVYVNEKIFLKDKDLVSISSFKELDLKDSLLVYFDKSKLKENSFNMYYTYFDVNSFEVKHCLGNLHEPADMINIESDVDYSTPVTLPLGKNSIWVLVTDNPISGEELNSFLGSFISDGRDKLWNILKHIVGFKSVNYNVVKQRKRLPN